MARISGGDGGDGRRERRWGRLEAAEEHVDQAALETTHRRAGGLALGPFLLVVRLRERLAAALGECDDVDRAVEPAVPAGIDAVGVAATGRDGERGDAGEGGERRGGVDARGAAELAEETRGDDRPDAPHRQQRRLERPHALLQRGGGRGDVGGELEEALGELPHDEQAGLHDAARLGHGEVVAVADARRARQRPAPRRVTGVELQHLRVELVDQARAIGDEVIPMVAQQAQLGAVVVGLDHGQALALGAQQPGHRQRVGRVGLVLRAAPPAILRRAVRDNLADVNLALRQQELREALAQRPAVLDAPADVLLLPSRPSERHGPPLGCVRYGAAAAGAPIRVDRHQHVRLLVSMELPRGVAPSILPTLSRRDAEAGRRASGPTVMRTGMHQPVCLFGRPLGSTQLRWR
ncbi:MAG: hypothetical protein AVDCRST_MAG11-2095 [uncultured Gemmatimonadaceae bacterium]|uniref:Uncharacterized protein n=1 Tax=uncultured Gemmatimonadaceae bacterium TaxID=246130 RepID=A0A6J4L5U5_9BACT|nr:MAG: hypothetical protein AVDCRST_MAG11-2095 [uncultured Gemmatimonadaceae bacterium]